MDTAPIRIRREDKARLRRLASDLGAMRSRPASQQETIGRALAFALRRRDEFLSEGTWKPLTEKEIKAWETALSKTKGWEAVRADDIDRIVYGA